MFENVFNGLFGKIAPNMCRLSMSGGIAVKTSNGYKTYNVKKKKLTNCDNFVLNVGDDLFFCLPTNKVAVGDIILVNGKPRCVIGTDSDTIKVINYEDSTIDEILPERHIFMGNTYYYGKIVSLFGNVAGGGANNLMKYMMLSQLMGGGNAGGFGGNNLLPLMLLSGENNSFDKLFAGLTDFGTAPLNFDVDDEDEEDADSEEA